jgi:hypothetical protein
VIVDGRVVFRAEDRADVGRDLASTIGRLYE